MGRVEGRVAIVTGGGRGIGAAIARLLAAEGAAVVVNDLGVRVDGTEPDSGPAATVAAEIERAGGRAVLNGADVSDFTQSRELVEQALDVYGRLDVVVNVAGILRDRMLFNMSEEEWDDVVRVHMRGTFNTMRHASAYWRELARPGDQRRIINFTSRSALHGAPGQPNYAAAKLGVVGLTYSAANALKKYGITVNAVAPNAASRMGASVPEGRRTHRTVGDDRAPENIAPVVLYLASEDSNWCTGQVFYANGYQVGMYQEPRLAGSIVSPGGWDLDELFDRMRSEFLPVLYGETYFGVPPRREPPAPPTSADLQDAEVVE